MKLVTKHPKFKNFWVEDFNQEERTFFEALGFKFVKSNMPKEFGGSDTLTFQGSDVFGLWTKEELKDILIQVSQSFGEVEIFQMDIYE